MFTSSESERRQMIEGYLQLTLMLISLVNVSPGIVNIDTKYGMIIGLSESISSNGGNISEVEKYLGIPFASPPLRKFRFQPPRPPTPWRPHYYNATYFRSACLQDSLDMALVKSKAWAGSLPTFDEDCLYLNIYSPSRNISSTTSSKYPVMVYIHGGSYRAGSALLYPGDILACKGVVVVTIQYRLGSLGFLTTGDSAARGNYGMLDQIQALRWIRENIRYFNGNPSEVTILGQSAGAFSVGLLLLSPLSKNLFHRAVALSGTDLSYASTQPVKHGIHYAKRLAKTLDCETRDSEEMVKCLREQNAFELINATSTYRFQKQFKLPFAPVVDNEFLLAEPFELRKAGRFHRVTFIAGVTDGEGSEIVKMDLQALNFSNIDNGVPVAVYNKYIKTGINRVLRDAKQFNRALVADALNFEYMPWPDNKNPLKLRRALVNLVSDFNYGAAMVQALSLHSKFAPAYMFEFRHSSKQSNKPKWMGAIHGDLVEYSFGFPYIKNNMAEPRDYDEEDRQISDLIMTLLTNFAKKYDPTYEPVLGATWSQLKENQTHYFLIQAKPRMSGFNFRPSQIAFWNFHFPMLINNSLYSRQVICAARNCVAWNLTILSVATLLVLSFFQGFLP